jgi:hypothetical protein
LGNLFCTNTYKDILIPSNITTLCAQSQDKKILESVAEQDFQEFSCGSFDR